MPDLRATTRVHAEIPDVQDLFSESRERRDDSRSHEIQLVGEVYECI